MHGSDVALEPEEAFHLVVAFLFVVIMHAEACPQISDDHVVDRYTGRCNANASADDRENQMIRFLQNMTGKCQRLQPPSGVSRVSPPPRRAKPFPKRASNGMAFQTGAWNRNILRFIILPTW